MFDKGTLQEVHSMGVTLCAVGASQLGVLLRPKTCLQGGLKVACDERGTKSLLDIIPVSRDALPGCARLWLVGCCVEEMTPWLPGGPPWILRCLEKR